MAEADSVRIELAFRGGPVYAALVTSKDADALEQALAAGAGGAHQLDTDDGRTTVVLGQVVYLKRYARDSKVGFGL